MCGSVYILSQFVAMMENMDANDYAAAFDADALPRLAGVIAGDSVRGKTLLRKPFVVKTCLKPYLFEI